MQWPRCWAGGTRGGAVWGWRELGGDGGGYIGLYRVRGAGGSWEGWRGLYRAVWDMQSQHGMGCAQVPGTCWELGALRSLHWGWGSRGGGADPSFLCISRAWGPPRWIRCARAGCPRRMATRPEAAR